MKMESKDELKEIDIKGRTCYYFDDTMRVLDIVFDNILLGEKSYENILWDKKLYENILIYDISYKTFMAAKPSHICLIK